MKNCVASIGVHEKIGKTTVHMSKYCSFYYYINLSQ